MDINLYIKHIFRLLPIYEKAQIDIYKDNVIIANIIQCLNELKNYHNYNHYNVRKIVLFCVNKLKFLK